MELLTRLKLEGEGTEADVVLGLDTNLISEAKATGLFEPHGLKPEGLAVPGGFPTIRSCPMTTAISPSSTTPRR